MLLTHQSRRYAYITDAVNNKLTIIDVSTPSNMSIVKVLSGADYTAVFNFEIYGDYLLYKMTSGMRILDISVPTNPQIVGGIGPTSVSLSNKFTVQGRYLYGVDSTAPYQLAVFDIGGLDAPNISTGGLSANVLDVSGDSFMQSVLMDSFKVARGGVMNGALSLTGFASSTNGLATTTLDAALYIASSTPLSTTNSLYQQGGTLYWNGSAVSVGSATSNWTTNSTSSVYLANDQIKVGIGTTTYATSSNTLTLAGTFWNGIGTSTNISVVGTTSPAGSPTFNDLDVQGQFAYTVDSTTLRIFNIGSTTKPVQVGSIALPNNAHKISVSGDIAYVTNFNGNSLLAYNITNPASPYQISSYPVQTSAVKSRGRFAYMTAYTGSALNVIDYASSTAPMLVSSSTVGANPYGVALGDNYAYVVGFGSNNLSVVDISNPYNIQTVGTVSGGGIMSDPTYSNGYVYAVQGSNIVAFDVTTPSAPVLVKTISAGGSAQGMEAKGRYLYVGSDSALGSLKIYDISNPISMSVVANVMPINTSIKGIRVVGKYAYMVNNGAKSINIVDVGGAEFGTLNAGAITSGSLHIIGDITAGGNISAEAGVFGAQGVTSFGGIAVIGTSSRSVFNGQVAIGTTTATSSTDRLRVAGDIQIGTTGLGCVRGATGAIISGTCSSDQDLKTNIQDIGTLLDRFANIKFVTYNWNQLAHDKLGNDINATNTGLIAQQVETQFPELISTSSLGFKQVDFTTLQFYAYKAIQELNNKIFGNSSKQIISIEEITASSTISIDDKLKVLGTNAKQVNDLLAQLASSTSATSSITTTETVTTSTSSAICAADTTVGTSMNGGIVTEVTSTTTPVIVQGSTPTTITNCLITTYSTTTTTTEDLTFIGKLLTRVIEVVKDMLANVGVEILKAKEVKADKVCMDDNGTPVCLDLETLKYIKSQMQQNTTSNPHTPNNNPSAGEPEPTPTPEPQPQPPTPEQGSGETQPEPTPEIQPTPETPQS